MVWGLRQRLSHTTLKDGVFDGFHSSITVHIINLPHNRLNRVTGIFPAPKLLTELRLGSNYFNRKFNSNTMKLDCLKKLYIFNNPVISGNVPSDIGNMTGLMDMDLYFTSLYGKIPSGFGLTLSLPRWTTCSRSNTSTLNCCSLLHIFYDFTGTSLVVVRFTHI